MFSTSAGMMPPCPDTDVTSWPEAFEQYRLGDAVLAQGFDSLLPSQRAAIKTGMAMHFALHGESSTVAQHCVHNRGKGFSYTAGTAPMGWTVLCISPDFAAGPRLVAALMPAVLAGVPLVGVVCVGGEPSASVCGCLELMGIEHIFCVPDEASAQHFLQHSYEVLGPLGCALFLHQGKLTPLYQSAQDFGLQCWQEATPPHVALHGSMAQAEALITWCHPDCKRVDTPDCKRVNTPDCKRVDTTKGKRISTLNALFSAQTDTPFPTQISPAPLVLGIGLEGFWWYPNLEPRFFSHKSLMACCFPDNFSKD